MKAVELVDLVDKDGNARMPGVRRIEVKNRKEELLAQGLYQPIVVVIVFDDAGQIIAQVRGEAKGDDDSGFIDHVCGVVASGETWQVAAAREAAEEIGVELDEIRLVDRRVNVYKRYRTLATARTFSQPKVLNPAEVSASSELARMTSTRWNAREVPLLKGTSPIWNLRFSIL